MLYSCSGCNSPVLMNHSLLPHWTSWNKSVLWKWIWICFKMKDVTEPDVRITMLNTGMLLHLRQPSTHSAFCLHLSLSDHCFLRHTLDTSLTLVEKTKAVCLVLCNLSTNIGNDIQVDGATLSGVGLSVIHLLNVSFTWKAVSKSWAPQ